MLLSLAAGRRLLVVGGKGGVGKTSVASAVALAEARRGRPVLLVSSDPAHNLAHLWQRPVGDAGAEVAPGLTAVEIDPATTTDAHLAAVRRTMHRLVAEHLRVRVDEHLDLARDAPGMHEAAVLERLAELVTTALADPDRLVVLDTAPSGHTARLLAMPRALGVWTDALLRGRDRQERLEDALRSLDRGGGDEDRARDDQVREVLLRRRRRFEVLKDVLTDPARTSFALVLTAERLPVLESVELHERLVGLGVAVGALVVNRRSPADAGDLLAARRLGEDEQVAVLRAALPGLPVVEVPLLADEVLGADGLARLVTHL